MHIRLHRFLLVLFLAASTYCSWGQKAPEYLTWYGKVITYRGEYMNNKRQLIRLSQQCSCETAANHFRLAQKTSRKVVGLTVPSIPLGLFVGVFLAVPIAYNTDNSGVGVSVGTAAAVGISALPALVLTPQLKKEMELGVEAFNQCVKEQSKGLQPRLESIPPP
jgi:hypothetical protein